MAYTLKDEFGATDNASRSFAYSTTVYAAFSFTPSLSYTATKVSIKLIKTGSPTGAATGYIYGNTSGSPGTLLGTSTNTVNYSDIGASAAYHDFLFDGVALTSGTTYWIVMTGDLGSVGNFPNARYNNVGALSLKTSADGSSWSLQDGSCEGTFQVYETAGGGPSAVPIGAITYYLRMMGSQ